MVIFSMWNDDSGCGDVKVSRAKLIRASCLGVRTHPSLEYQICLNLFKEIDHGEGVIVSKFGGEGTGFKSMKDVEWKNNEDVTLIVKGEIDKERNDGKG